MFFAIPSTVEILGYIPRLTLEQLKDQITADNYTEYTSARGRHCFRTFGGLDWYIAKCDQMGIRPKCLASGLHYEAAGNGYTLEYCEHDIILAFDA